MKNNLINLNEILFQQIEKLTTNPITDQELKIAQTVNNTANSIIASGKLMLDYKKLYKEAGQSTTHIPLFKELS